MSKRNQRSRLEGRNSLIAPETAPPHALLLLWHTPELSVLTALTGQPYSAKSHTAKVYLVHQRTLGASRRWGFAFSLLAFAARLWCSCYSQCSSFRAKLNH